MEPPAAPPHQHAIHIYVPSQDFLSASRGDTFPHCSSGPPKDLDPPASPHLSPTYPDEVANNAAINRWDFPHGPGDAAEEENNLEGDQDHDDLYREEYEKHVRHCETWHGVWPLMNASRWCGERCTRSSWDEQWEEREADLEECRNGQAYDEWREASTKKMWKKGHDRKFCCDTQPSNLNATFHEKSGILTGNWRKPFWCGCQLREMPVYEADHWRFISIEKKRNSSVRGRIEDNGFWYERRFNEGPGGRERRYIRPWLVGESFPCDLCDGRRLAACLFYSMRLRDRVFRLPQKALPIAVCMRCGDQLDDDMRKAALIDSGKAIKLC
jgi:hypothetical protein